MNKIALFSVPRSGSTWLGQILNSSPEVMYRFQPNFAYSFPLTLSEVSTNEEIEEFHRQLQQSKDPFVTGKLSISSKNNLEFPKKDITALIWKETHFIHLAETLLKNSNTKVVGLIRSPLAVLNSWRKIPKEFDPAWSLKEEWRSAPKKNENKKSHYFGYEKWKEATLLFERLNKDFPERFYLITYEALLNDTKGEIKQLFEFLDLNFFEQTKKFIEESRSSSVKDAYGVFKKRKKDEDWKNELPSYIVEEVKKDLSGSELKKYI